MDFVFAAGLGFVLGSIPFGLILTRAAGLGDVRQIGSGSIGATNVLRTGNKGLAAATVLLDAGKGVVAVLLAPVLFASEPAVAGDVFGGLGQFAAVGAVMGHCFTPWLNFKGGKGFATAAGVLAAMAWPVMLICAAIWAATLALSRISSVSSMVAVVAAPVVAGLWGDIWLISPLVVIAVIVLVQHRANIGRLMRGEEPKVGAKS